MSSTAQTVAALNRNLGISNAGHWAAKLRAAGLLQSSQGAPLDLPARDVVRIVLGVMIGFAAANTPALVDDYFGLTSADGQKLGDVIERFVAAPHDLYELSVSNAVPAAAIAFRDANRSTQTLAFTGPVEARPGFTRSTTITADCWQHLAADLNDPTQQRRRPRRRRKTQ